MKFIKFFQILLLAFVLSACVEPRYMKQNSAFILFRTPTFKYADMGFVYENSDEVKVEIYESGQALMSLRISETSVCMSLLECMSKEDFNRKVLSRLYPQKILDNIFRGKPIFRNRNLKRNRNGFTQTLTNKNKYNIHYRVLNNKIVFSDTINEILIKVIKQ
ncbi:hypothetical protein [Sulfurovum sp.]|uniref:hypothetical protein n=1 Tax=Sulfurovum sp. TaxID=1969726 RepID=UPI0025F0768D|nr:hypothetical protein [Sulfurovum sp.]